MVDLRQIAADALRGHRIDGFNQDSGKHCECGSDSRFEQRDGDGPWADIEEHRADVVLRALLPRLVHPNRADERDVRPWEPEDGDSRCQECGRPNLVWYTDHALWNQIMPTDGILCIGCFVHRAEQALGVGAVWALLHESTDISNEFRRGLSVGMAITDGRGPADWAAVTETIAAGLMHHTLTPRHFAEKAVEALRG